MYWRIVAPLKRSVSIGFAGPGGGGGGGGGGAVLLNFFSKIQLQLYENKITISINSMLFLINKHKSINSSAYYPVRIAMLFIANI